MPSHFFVSKDELHCRLVTHTITPSSSASSALNSDNDPSASVSVTVTPIIPTITLSGVTVFPSDKSVNIIVGQQLTATLNLGGYTLQSGDTTVWSISAGQPFAKFDPKASSNQLTAWSSPTALSTNCHFAQGDVELDVFV